MLFLQLQRNNDNHIRHTLSAHNGEPHEWTIAWGRVNFNVPFDYDTFCWKNSFCLNRKSVCWGDWISFSSCYRKHWSFFPLFLLSNQVTDHELADLQTLRPGGEILFLRRWQWRCWLWPLLWEYTSLTQLLWTHTLSFFASSQTFQRIEWVVRL